MVTVAGAGCGLRMDSLVQLFLEVGVCVDVCLLLKELKPRATQICKGMKVY